MLRMEVPRDVVREVERAFGDAFEVVGEAGRYASVEWEGALREATPVDTGYAMNSWLVTEDPNDIGTPGNNPGSTISMISPKALYSGGIYINNGAEYILALENGHSQQAPNGMIDATLPTVPNIYSRALRKAIRNHARFR